MTLTLNQKVNESLLLTTKVVEFRNTYPELIAQWEGRIGQENCHPDLYFCFALLDNFPKLGAFLAMLEYRIGFAINACIVHANWQQEFIELGYKGNLALELANHEVQLTFNALNESETIAEDPKAKIYHDILTGYQSSNF